jgi:hypothetical protein
LTARITSKENEMSRQTIDEASTEFTITRAFSAPLATVWDGWTRPEHLAVVTR